MKINEIFFSINGEGRFAGLSTAFIRTFQCNLHCSYCDTLYAVDGDEYTEMSVDEIISRVAQYKCKRVTATGGEPLLQDDMLELVRKLVSMGYEVEIETNGAVPVDDYINLDHVVLTMDWKCPSSKMYNKMIPENLAKLRSSDVVKCVVGSREDLDCMKNDVVGHTSAQVYVSPVFGEIDLPEIAQYLMDNGLDNVRYQLQIHKFIWDSNMRGV